MSSLDELEARLSASGVSPRPWYAHFNAHGDPAVNSSFNDRKGFTRVATPSTSPADYGRANAELIAAAVNALPRLIAIARAAALKRNAIARDFDLHTRGGATSPFVGEWVVIPREDFDALRDALDALSSPAGETTGNG